MLTAEPINNFNGFGTGQTPGEYFYSEGMSRSQFGISTKWSISKVQDDTDLPTLQLGSFYTQGVIGGTSYVYQVDSSGNIYRSVLGLESWSLVYKPAVTTHGNGLFIDQKNRLLYATDRYLGKFDPAVSNHTSGTVTISNGSTGVVGVGTAFTSDMIGKVFRVAGDNNFYTVAAFGDATHISLTTPYVGAVGASAYTIYLGWDDTWKDFGASYSTTTYRQIDAFEDWLVIANLNSFALLNVTDDSFEEEALTLPSGYKSVAVQSGKNGNLLGLNFNNRGAVLLWDAAQTRAIAPWIWYNGNIKAIIKEDESWIVITSRGIHRTNGYSSQEVRIQFPDDQINRAEILSTLLPQGAALIGSRLAFWGTPSAVSRKRGGLYFLDLNSGLLEFVPVASKVTFSVTGGAILFDSNYTTHLSYTTNLPSQSVIGRLSNTNSSRALLITEPKGGNTANIKSAEGVKLSLAVNSQVTTVPAYTFTLSAKIATQKRNMWVQAQTTAISAAEDVLKVNGTIFVGVGRVGDEVTILDGVNAGQVRHIESISGAGTATELWTLDSELPELTESSVTMVVSPFKLIHTHTITDADQLPELYFGIKNKIKGRRFLLKFLIEDLPSSLELEIQDGLFLYDDQGTKKGE